MAIHWVSVHAPGFAKVTTVSVSPALPVIVMVTALMYLARNALTPTRMILSTVSDTESALRWLFEFSKTIEIVAFDAVNGLVEPEQESRKGTTNDERMSSHESLLHIVQFSSKN